MAMVKGHHFPKGKSTMPKNIPQPAAAGSLKPGGSATVSIRPIDNGYLIEKSSWDGKGNYKSSTVYSKTKPKIEV